LFSTYEYRFKDCPFSSRHYRFAKGIVAEGFSQACALKLAGAFYQVAFVIKLKTQVLDVLVAIAIACGDGVDQAIG